MCAVAYLMADENATAAALVNTVHEHDYIEDMRVMRSFYID